MLACLTKPSTGEISSGEVEIEIDMASRQVSDEDYLEAIRLSIPEISKYLQQ